MNNDPQKNNTRSTRAEKEARVLKVVDLLRLGQTRADIVKTIKNNYNISEQQIDFYIADAKEIIDKERNELNDIIKNERVTRALEASKKIPTNEELIAMLAKKIDLANPDVTGYELKIIKDEPHNIQRFASETFVLTAIAKIIEYNNKLNGTDQPQQQQAVLVINTNEVLITNEEDLTDE